MSAIDPDSFRDLSLFFEKVKGYLEDEYGISICGENKHLFNSHCMKSYWGGENCSNTASWFVQENKLKGLDVDAS